MRHPIRMLAGPALAALLAAACDSGTQPTAPLDASTASRGPASGFVATASNDAAGNAVLVFPRAANGALGAPQAYPTGGTGSGAGLGNQGGLVRDGHWLLAVNAGSNDVSVFAIEPGGLYLTDRKPSGGTTPISVTLHDGLVYVLNAGGSGNISGFRLSPQGRLTPVPGSTRPLSTDASGPAQIAFTPDGRRLVITEKATQTITVYLVARSGLAFHPRFNHSSGVTPFGFGFDRAGRLLVSEAFGGATDASAVSSYFVYRFGALRVVSASVPNTETAACWVAVSGDGRWAYVTNTGSASISGYRVLPNGRIELRDPDGVTGTTGATPIDLAFSPDDRLLYSLNAGAHSISGFGVRNDGSLESLGETAGLPLTANGLAAW